jgi:hypothetical protein
MLILKLNNAQIKKYRKYSSYFLILIIILSLILSVTFFGCKLNSKNNNQGSVENVASDESKVSDKQAESTADKSSVNDSQKDNTNSTEIKKDVDKILFTFTIAGDNRPANNTLPQPQVFLSILQQMKRISPAFFISTGDVINGNTQNQKVIERQYQDYLGAVKVLSCINFVSPGNHDVANTTSRNYFVKWINNKVFNGIGQSDQSGINIVNLNEDGSLGGNPDISESNSSNNNSNMNEGTKLYYGFEFKGIYFVILDAYERGYWGLIKAEELQWLEKILERLKDEKVFVFLHPPVYSVLNPDCVTDGSLHVSFSSKKNQDYIKELFKKFKVDGVFGGHEHLFDKQKVDDTEYIITAGAGAPLYASKEKGGFYHFLKINVKENSWICNVMDKDGNLVGKEEILFN